LATGEKLIIVGDGISYNDNLRLVEELELENKVVLLKNVSNTEKEKLLSSCKALVLSSIFPSEAFALVQLEAMKFRKPIINTDLNTGVPWVARHEKEALTVKSRSIDDLAEAITKLSLSETLRKELGSNGVKRLSVVFGFEKFKQGVLKFLSI